MAEENALEQMENISSRSCDNILKYKRKKKRNKKQNDKKKLFIHKNLLYLKKWKASMYFHYTVLSTVNSFCIYPQSMYLLS